MVSILFLNSPHHCVGFLFFFAWILPLPLPFPPRRSLITPQLITAPLLTPHSSQLHFSSQLITAPLLTPLLTPQLIPSHTSYSSHCNPSQLHFSHLAYHLTTHKMELRNSKNEAFLQDFLQKWSFEAQKRSFSARLPSKMGASKLKNEAFLQDFLQKWELRSSKTKLFCETSFKNGSFEAQKRSFSARLPSKMKLRSSKTKLFCETSFKNGASKLKNEKLLRDILQKSWPRVHTIHFPKSLACTCDVCFACTCDPPTVTPPGNQTSATEKKNHL